jgi:OOP family OmpA-OmpF porin
MNKILYFLAILLLISPLPKAWAQIGDWYIAPVVVYTDDDGQRNIDDSLAGGAIGVGRRLSRNFAVEGMFGYSDIKGFPGQSHLDLSLNVLAYLAPNSAFSPYFMAGAGYLGTETTTGSTENRPSGTMGVGFHWNLGDSAVSIRGEYRARLAWEDNNNLTDRIGSLGLQLSFGRAPEPLSDTDRDGVHDVSDRCPRSEPGVVVDGVGCELDADNDGVVDSQDVCPDTPSGIEVDSFGCRSDSDRDGVTNSVDQCPRTVAGAAVDSVGCELDDDGDSVVNRLDQCPDTTAGVRVDVNGCEIRNIINLPGVNFASNSDLLLPGAERVLADAVATLGKYPELIVEVAGHTDSDGADVSNLGLSERRAKTVRDYLVNGGVNATSLSVRGFGESQPVADNSTAAGKAQNRRVELRILDQ